MATVPQERLNQIAQRRLAGLGLDAFVGQSGVLEGKLALQGVVIPGAAAPITRARFAVVSHDQLRFLDPPLAALAPLPFYDVKSTAELETRVRTVIEHRLRSLQQLTGDRKSTRLNSSHGYI